MPVRWADPREEPLLSDDHDPFNEPELAHPRARELLVEPFFWDCADEEAPFGSDEGHTAYFEFRRWRSVNRSASLLGCVSWILEGKLDSYTPALHSDAQVRADLENPDEAAFADSFDMFTLDATLIATGLGQLLDEGTIDAPAKPFLKIAVTRQLHPAVVTSEHRGRILRAVARVLDVA